MKKFESAQEVQLVPWQPYVVRVDGHLFSKFTKKFKKPYDVRIFEAMLKTTADLLIKFNAVTGYTQSDEITLVFPAARKYPEQTEKNFVYDGRINKIATLIAGYCSVRFVYHMLQTKFEEGEDVEGFKKNIFQTFFDARAYSLPSLVEVLENLAWRTSDVKRNSKNNLGFQYYSHKELVSMSPSEVINKLKNEKGVLWSDMPEPYKFGCFVKREQYKSDFISNGKVTGTTTRTRLVHGCIDLHDMCIKEENEGVLIVLNEKELRKVTNFLMEKFHSPVWASHFTTMEHEQKENKKIKF